MATNDDVKNPKDEKDIADNNNAGSNDDVTGENAGDSELSKGSHATEQNKPDDTRVDTVVPDNDNGAPGPSTEESSNKGQGPSGENL
ncbi:hypothetical protein [Mucilaginibacter sp.]